MPNPGKPIPDGYHSLTPYLCLKDARKAIKFYEQAFGAVQTVLMPGPDGRIMHAELQIGDSMLMLGEECPQQKVLSVEHYQGSPVSMMIYLENVDAAFDRATKAGAQAIMPPMDMFWGDRMCKVADPFGYHWAMATHKLDLSPEEMKEAAAKAMASQPA